MTLQHWKPDSQHLNVGDPMPIAHGGTFHLFYLLDSRHHQANQGLGSHNMAHASSPDLVNWTHHPLAVALHADDQDPISICTGSLLVHEGVWYAFYATRELPPGLPVKQHRQYVSVATSTDGVHFRKSPENPIVTPRSPYTTRHFRDPCVWRATDGLFHMLVTASLEIEPAYWRGGCLAHLTSRDMLHWDWQEPMLTPGVNRAPECPDYFEWNGWYYLAYLNGTVYHYLISRQPFGPWERPPQDTLDGQMAAAFKTASWGDRRLAVAFLRTRQDRQDTGAWLYAGRAVFRELVQHPDGSLGTRFVDEMTPQGELLRQVDALDLQADDGFRHLALDDVPADARITMTITPKPGVHHYGLGLRGSDNYELAYELRLSPHERRVRLRHIQRPVNNPGDRFENGLHLVHGLAEPMRLEIVMRGSVIDVCIDGRRTLIDRGYELSGSRLFFFAESGRVRFHDITIHTLESR